MTGRNAAAHPGLVDAVHRAGHAVGNHTWDHPSLPLISSGERRRQIRKTAALLPQAGRPLFRPPYGHLDYHSHRDLWLAGQQVIAWSCIVPDWEGQPAAGLLEIAMKGARPGAILVMHDGLCDFLCETSRDRRPTLEVLDGLLSQLSVNYQFVTVPELMRRGRPVRQCWRMDPDVEVLNQLLNPDGPGHRYPCLPTNNPRSGVCPADSPFS